MVFPLGSCSVNYHSICFPSQALSRCHNPTDHHSPRPFSAGTAELPRGGRGPPWILVLRSQGTGPDPKASASPMLQAAEGKAQTIMEGKSWHLRNSLIVYKTSAGVSLSFALSLFTHLKAQLGFPPVLHLERPCGVQAQSIGLGTLEP